MTHGSQPAPAQYHPEKGAMCRVETILTWGGGLARLTGTADFRGISGNRVLSRRGRFPKEFPETYDGRAANLTPNRRRQSERIGAPASTTKGLPT